MLSQETLFKENNPLCEGCSILCTNSGPHAILDYEYDSEVDILFLSDSLHMFQGDYVPFRVNEYKAIMKAVKDHSLKIGFSASVKCPEIKDLGTEDRKICRAHLVNTILTYKPKLVFSCGSQATQMLFGKSKGAGSRGTINNLTMGNFSFKACPIFHPWQVVSEPKNEMIFNMDIANAISDIITKPVKINNFKFETIVDVKQLTPLYYLFDTTSPISVDIETTGLNFLEDIIQTIALSEIDESTGEPINTWAIPIDHKESPFNYGDKVTIFYFLGKVLSNKNNHKIFQNAKFDIRFLMRYGLTEFENVFDTKIMQHFIREDIPKSLKDLVTYYHFDEFVRENADS